MQLQNVMITSFCCLRSHLITLTIQVSGGSTSLGRNAKNEMMTCILRASSKIPQLDGPIPDPYDDVLSTPNVSVFNAVVTVALLIFVG